MFAVLTEPPPSDGYRLLRVVGAGGIGCGLLIGALFLFVAYLVYSGMGMG